MVNNIGYGGDYLSGFGGGTNCICSFPTLVILILIVLQFSRCNYNRCTNYDD